MATRAQVQRLLDEGHDYRTAGEALGIPPGAAYLIATGRPADGSDGRYFTDQRELPASPQRLVGPLPANPIRNAAVEGWVRARAARELSR